MLRHFLQMVLQEDKESSIKEQMKNKLNPQKKEKGLFRYHFQLFLQKPSQLFFCFVLILPKGQPIKKKGSLMKNSVYEKGMASCLLWPNWHVLINKLCTRKGEEQFESSVMLLEIWTAWKCVTFDVKQDHY